MISDFVTDPHDEPFNDPDDGYPGVCKRPRGHAGDCAIAPAAADLTLDEAIEWLLGTFKSDANGVHRFASFARDCRRMIESLSATSFPIPHTISISVGDESDPAADVVLTEGTARLLHAALGAALGLPNPRRLASE